MVVILQQHMKIVNHLNSDRKNKSDIQIFKELALKFSGELLETFSTKYLQPFPSI